MGYGLVVGKNFKNIPDGPEIFFGIAGFLKIFWGILKIFLESQKIFLGKYDALRAKRLADSSKNCFATLLVSRLR